MRLKIISSLFILSTLGWLSCKKWADHDAVTNPALHNSLLQLINSDTSLSQFSALLTKTGYDKVISSSKSYTVWAPKNAALAGLDPTVTGDPAKLQQFVANHIANQPWLTSLNTQPRRVQMLNGKFVLFSATRFDSAHIVKADQYAANGILQVIDSAVYALPSIWEFVNNTTTSYAQNSFLVSLNYEGFDSTRATLDSVNPLTGQNVWVPGTGLVPRNGFTDNYAINSEDSLYTYFIIKDANYNAAVTAQQPYFVTSTPDSTNTLAGFNVLKDLAVSGQYNYSQLPDSLVLLSQFNVRIPIVKSAITEVHRVSNGIVYVLDHISTPLSDQIAPIYIQGEKPSGFSINGGSAVSYRSLINPVTGLPFKDIYVYAIGGSFTVRYHVRNVYSTRYHVYWSAINDIQTTSFKQRIAMDSSLTTFPYDSVPVKNYTETYLGDYTTTAYGSHEVYLINTNSTTTGVNTLDLDYVKLVPF